MGGKKGKGASKPQSLTFRLYAKQRALEKINVDGMFIALLSSTCSLFEALFVKVYLSIQTVQARLQSPTRRI
jgi:hypothetical protein